jgi:hypothetical protein
VFLYSDPLPVTKKMIHGFVSFVAHHARPIGLDCLERIMAGVSELTLGRVQFKITLDR